MLDRRCHATLVPGDPPRATRLALWSPDAAGSAEPGDAVELVLPDGDGVRAVTVPARLVPLDELLDDLARLAPDAAGVSGSLRAWAVVARHALALIARGRLQPGISPSGWDAWALGPLDDSDRSRAAALAAWLPVAAHCARVDAGEPLRIVDPATAVAAFCQAVADVLPRTAAAGTVSRQPAWCAREPVDVRALAPLLPVGEVPARTVVGLRVALPELPPVGDTDSEDPAVGIGRPPVRIELQVRSGEDPGRVAPAEELWAGTAAGFGAEAEADLLLALRRGARVWPPLAALLEQRRPSGLDVADDEALALLGPLADELGAAGIEVLVPTELTRTLRATPYLDSRTAPAGRATHFSLDALCELTWRPELDGEPVPDEELARLAAASRPLVRLRDGWVVVDPEVLARLGRRRSLPGGAALAAALGAAVELDGEQLEPAVGGPLAELADRLRAAPTVRELVEPEGLRATLRPYQRRGVAWLTEMVELGVGGVLADDMGLGKTVQLIALHLHRTGASAGPTMVVCPASLVGNWERELARFAPGVRVHRYHGPGRRLVEPAPADVVVTTYGIVLRDRDRLSSTRWGLVVADEAQQVKNPTSATAAALRALPSAARVAMTGTPVENRLVDLWALLDWTTPGLLGPLAAFQRNVAIPVERDRDPDASERLARLLGPFVLRRRKDDPDVAPDLPPKTETDHPVALTAEQAGLYRAALDENLEAVRRADGMARRGLVLRLLTTLKQICNHPAQHLRQPGPLAGRSGKLAAFDDLVTAISDAGDATLVFTQYVTMGELLMARLAELGIDARFLHGSLDVARRTELVDRFQEGGFPVFVLSLRAGGTGLNLTRATHVVHYDRWWNPAVEDQASDRTWRIGQDRPVQVHRLVCDGTVEERIAAVLADKRRLADAVASGGEAWLTELDDDELADLVRLGEPG